MVRVVVDEGDVEGAGHLESYAGRREIASNSLIDAGHHLEVNAAMNLFRLTLILCVELAIRA
ncbi:MAG: hypothetical protein Rubg2KO_31140 [Rubricoccaceae bacterium]